MEGIKEKKITVKFFLNEAVEAAIGPKGEKHYPLYVQVTYNRKNMQFKSKYSEYYGSLEEVKPGLMQFEENMITAIIRYEASREKDEYELKGLKRKYEVYSTSILEALEHYVKPKLRLAILKTNSELSHVFDFSNVRATVDLLYTAAHLLFKDFDSYLTPKLKEELQAYHHYQKLYSRPLFTFNFPTLIDWINGSYPAALEKKLTVISKNKVEVIKSVKSLLDHAVKAKVKQLDE